MTTRILPKADYHRLMATELAPLAAHLPEAACVLVVEEEETLLGCWALIPIWHVEGFWIAPAHRRRGGVARALLRGMAALLSERGVRHVTTGALTPEMSQWLERLGAARLPGDHYVWSPQRGGDD